MIGFAECENIASLLLIDLSDLDAMLDQIERVEHQSNPVKDIGPRLEKLTKLYFSKGIKLLLLGFWHHIPGFGRAQMVVVQTVDVEVLNVPAERGKLHSQIDPGRCHSANSLGFVLDDPEKGLLGLIDIVEIVEILLILQLGPRNVEEFSLWKT